MKMNIPETALFVCFRRMSNVGLLSGLAVLEAIQQLPPKKTGPSCLGGLPTEAPALLTKTHPVDAIIEAIEVGDRK
jgi:hypothetical protein